MARLGATQSASSVSMPTSGYGTGRVPATAELMYIPVGSVFFGGGVQPANTALWAVTKSSTVVGGLPPIRSTTSLVPAKIPLR